MLSKREFPKLIEELRTVAYICNLNQPLIYQRLHCKRTRLLATTGDYRSNERLTLEGVNQCSTVSSLLHVDAAGLWPPSCSLLHEGNSTGKAGTLMYTIQQ